MSAPLKGNGGSNGKTPRRQKPVAARVFQRLKRVLLNLPVAMLELLARTAVAQFVATQLLLVANRCGSESNVNLLAQHFRLLQAWSLFMQELHASGQCLGFLTQALLLFDRVFAANLNVGQHTDRIALDRIQQLGEQGEGLALVFLLRVLL